MREFDSVVRHGITDPYLECLQISFFFILALKHMNPS